MEVIRGIAIAALLLTASPLVEAKRPEPLTEEQRTVSQIYEVPGVTRDQLFVAARMWVAQNFKSAKAVIEYESKDDGTIIGNGNITYPCSGLKCMVTTDWRVNFTMKIECKDGKIRLTFTNINLTWPASYSSGISVPAHDGPVSKPQDMERIRPELLKLGESLVASVGQAGSEDDW